MQSRRTIGWFVLLGILLLMAAALGWGLWHYQTTRGVEGIDQQQSIMQLIVVVSLALAMVCMCGYWLTVRWRGHRAYHLREADGLVDAAEVTTDILTKRDHFGAMIQAMHEQHGRFWRRKVRVLLVFGDAEQIDAIAPGLEEKRWLADQLTVLLWVGSARQPVQRLIVSDLQALFRWRAPDSVVWVMSPEQTHDAATMGLGGHHLRSFARLLRWQLPLHLWQLCTSERPQLAREVEPIGCLLAPHAQGKDLQASLQQLQPALRDQGLAQLQTNLSHDFLLRLSRDLGTGGEKRWRVVLTSLSGRSAVVLRGLWFSLPVSRPVSTGLDHHWIADPAWLGVCNAKTDYSKRLAWNLPQVIQALVLLLLWAWVLGLLLSYASNRAEVGRVEAALATLQQPAQGHDSRVALTALVRELSRLDYRSEHGAPWYQRFGLDRSEARRISIRGVCKRTVS